MLILARDSGESIQIADNIKVTVLANNNGQVGVFYSLFI